ncbi:hypothetical protein KL86PLE_90280 [uncultured Pleomorphomonas sp.]|uniref:Uncharacterized protein n=1 Tax=uncultured Pleomorphomonas sp. TaxID=442121 RepID=A0A212LNS6_9HYPH|nr:hypothetical protein KL86PLE_90280 [uncultured Pleomorphomonas sp.]
MALRPGRGDERGTLRAARFKACGLTPLPGPSPTRGEGTAGFADPFPGQAEPSSHG